MKRSTLALIATLLAPMSATVYAQTPGTTPTGVIPAQGTSVAPGTIPSQGVNVDPSVTTTQTQQNRDAQSAQQNSLRANPTQSAQQAGGGGVFGPSSGPGIFGPAGQNGQTVQTDIYGNAQLSTGTATPQNQAVSPAGDSAVNQSTRAAQSTRPGQTMPPPSTDAAGYPLPNNGQVQNPLPRDLQPLNTSPVQPLQPSSSMTGR